MEVVGEREYIYNMYIIYYIRLFFPSYQLRKSEPHMTDV